jgi:hypothetical protein
MNGAERRRDLRISAMPDLELLDVVCADFQSEDPDSAALAAFVDMRKGVSDGNRLTRRQREWAESLARQVVPLDWRDAPRGHEVETPDVLKTLPKKPPRRVTDV